MYFRKQTSPAISHRPESEMAIVNSMMCILSDFSTIFILLYKNGIITYVFTTVLEHAIFS